MEKTYKNIKLHEYYSKPENRAKVSRQSKLNYQNMTDEEKKAKSEKLKAAWTEEKRREKSIQSKQYWTEEKRKEQSIRKKEYSKNHPFIHSEETKKLLSEQHKQLWQNPEYREHMSKKRKEYKPTKETIEKCRNISNQFWSDPENHKKASDIMTNRWAKIKSGKITFNHKEQ